MGSHQIVHLEAGGQQLSAIDHEQRSFAVGAAVRFAVDVHRASLFDPDSGQRLCVLLPEESEAWPCS